MTLQFKETCHFRTSMYYILVCIIFFYFSDNSDWCYAELLSTGEKGYVPIAYICHASQKLISQEYENLFIFVFN
jgi:hypothetical protein